MTASVLRAAHVPAPMLTPAATPTTALTPAPTTAPTRPRPAVEAWLYRPVPRGLQARQLVCFPHAGGDVTAFAALAEESPAGVEVAAVRLPGRGGRFREAMPSRFDELVADVAEGIRTRIRPGSVFYGQSFGALLAYEVARALPRALRPALLVPACAPAPQDWHGTVPDPADGALDLFRACGLADQLPDDSGLRELTLGVLRADLAVCRSYRHRPAPGFDTPIHAVAGADDPVLAAGRLQAWAQATEGPFAATVVPGGHLLACALDAGPADLLARLAVGDPLAAGTSPATDLPQGARP
ncbi:pyochelin biosynthetic protein PchC [Catenulispora sp. GAS73]|uniref:thioesterase II family protein n=1 Tax=Catenulispora sp. GAS73 TaxID=3156269 RepID=UPI0035187C3F